MAIEIIESEFLRGTKKMISEKHSNIAYTDPDLMYNILFIHGVNETSLNEALKLMRLRINKSIK